MNVSELTACLDPDSYKNDRRVGFGVFEKDADPDSYIYVPERLVERLVHLGRAYKLHVIQMIDIHEDLYLNGLQCQNLTDEIRFLAGFIDDPALTDSLAPLMQLLSEIETSPSVLGLKVSGL